MTTVFRVAWFGDSIMEHLEGYAAPLFDQAALPAVGSAVTVESWRHRGYVERLRLSLLADWPGLDFRFGNHAVGGATSRDLLPIVERVTQEAPEAPGADIAFLGCGVNDAWPAFSAAAGHPGARPAGPGRRWPLERRGPLERRDPLERRGPPQRTRRHHRAARGRAAPARDPADRRARGIRALAEGPDLSQGS